MEFCWVRIERRWPPRLAPPAPIEPLQWLWSTADGLKECSIQNEKGNNHKIELRKAYDGKRLLRLLNETLLFNVVSSSPSDPESWTKLWQSLCFLLPFEDVLWPLFRRELLRLHGELPLPPPPPLLWLRSLKLHWKIIIIPMLWRKTFQTFLTALKNRIEEDLEATKNLSFEQVHDLRDSSKSTRYCF